jgi:hypothetical protein
MMRSLLTVISGLITGGFAVRLFEWIGHRIAPPPAGLKIEDFDALRAYVASAPPKVFYLLLAAWAGGAFVGGFAAGHVAERRKELHALVVGLLQTALAGWQLSMIPHPTWVVVIGLTLFVPFAWLGGRIFAGEPEAVVPGV